jgi:hypothetical protein
MIESNEVIQQKIFPIDLVLDSMKDNGYKDAAHAIAELIDNSIQAGLELEYKTEVELLCIEQDSFISNRTSRRIEKIAVYDNACGMDVPTLRASLAFGQGTRKNAKKGIGKFGMGLPNASISQCNRVDVYSWTESEVYHTYLDIKEIAKKGYDLVPEPQKSEIPAEWKSLIKSEIRPSGTLVVWSDLDRLKWRRHKAFFSNVEFIVGRMYRYFLSEDKCSIRMAAQTGEEIVDGYVKPNDPLYLMDGTEFSEKVKFIPFGEEEKITVKYKDKEHQVRLRFSICDHQFRKNFNSYFPESKYGQAGDTPFGKHCAKNLGISIVRAGRELELNNSFTVVYDPRERFWGAEIYFEPELDEVFGVTNNKQAATALQKLSLDEIKNEEGYQSTTDARSFLEAEGDIRLPVIELSEVINSKLSAIRDEIKKQTEGSKSAKNYTGNESAAALIASQVDKNIDGEGESDKKTKTLTDDEKRKQLEEELDKDGVSLSETDKLDVINEALSNNEKFIITSADMRGADIIFDVTTPAGKLKVTINESHPIYKHLFSNFIEDQKAFDMVRLLFSAWAVMEDKQQNEQYKDWLLEARKEWGYIVKKMLQEYVK